MLSKSENLSTEECRPSDVLKTKPENGVANEESNKIWYKKYKIRWTAAIFHASLDLLTLYALVTFPYIEKYKTFLWAIFMHLLSLFGTGAGTHRLWTHRSYKAKLPLQILLALCYTPSLQMPISQWIRIHRVHHKYSDTEDDPHNSRNGFFYAHVGWVLAKKSPSILEKYKKEDMTDINENPVISFFDRYYWRIALFLNLITVAIPVYCWDEDWYYAYMSQLARFVVTFNFALGINSIAHNFGDKPFNKNIFPADNRFASYITLGEGWHNYHHVFPYDYRTPELVGLRFDVIAKSIEFFEKIGWAYDLRKPKDELVKMVIKNKGDDTLQSVVK